MTSRQHDDAMRPGLTLWFAVIATVTLLLFSYKHLATLASGGDETWLRPFMEESVAVLGAGLLFFAVLWWVQRLPLDEPDRWRRWQRVPLYLVALLAFSALHTSWNWGVRTVLFPVVGLGPYHYGIMPLRYAMEFPADIAIFTLMILFLHGARHLRRSRERELRAARLESGLAQAELRSLHLQIQPHFLFNALNTISSTLYEDPARADEMIDRLGELLRASLRTARSDEVSLREELQTLDAYLSLLAARFEDRLTVELDIADDVVSARVPPFLLQPLVENAVRHGGVESRGRGTIRLTARREGDEVVLTVLDDGPGLTPGVQETLGSEGIGLSATAERLQLLYGDEQRFTAATRPEGGFCVEIRLQA